MAVSKRQRKPMNLFPATAAVVDQEMTTRVKPSRIAVDQWLRDNGFAIVARPAGSEPRWRRRGCVSVLLQSHAVALVTLESRRKAAADERYGT